MDDSLLKDISSFSKPNLKKTTSRIYYLNGKQFTSNDGKSEEKEITLEQDNMSANTYASRMSGYVVDITPDKSVDKIIDRLYLSADDVATDLKLLKEHNITHIINVTTNVPNKFEPEIVYKKIKIYDFPSQNIDAYFKETYEFVEKAFEDENTSVLVHCNMGVSRSSTIIIAYLLQKRIFTTYQNAYEHVKSQRPKISPNNGFKQQLIKLERQLNQ